MATTTNYGWTTPDDTALVKDGASAIRTLGSSVDTTVKALSPGTTAGDIDYYTSSTAKSRLAIGSTGQVLTVAAGVPSWATTSGGSTSFTLLNAGGTALTGATTVTVSGISSQDKLWVYITGASSANANSYIGIRINTDTASNYYYTGLRYGSASSGYTVQDVNNDNILIGQNGTAATVLSGSILIDGTKGAGVKVFDVKGAGETLSFNTKGYWSGTASVTSISIISSTGNLDAGTVYVYGSSN